MAFTEPLYGQTITSSGMERHRDKPVVLFGIPKTGTKYVVWTFRNTPKDPGPLWTARFRYLGHGFLFTPKLPVYSGFAAQNRSAEASGIGDHVGMATIRNPFSHLYSIYNYGWSAHWRVSPLKTLLKADSFEDFIDRFCGEAGDVAAPYFSRCLSFQLFLDDGRCAADYLIRTERLSDGLTYICGALNIDPVRKPNRTLSERKDGGGQTAHPNAYQSAYSTKARDMVEKRFGRELEAYGYNFDGPTDDRATLSTEKIRYSPHEDTFA